MGTTQYTDLQAAYNIIIIFVLPSFLVTCKQFWTNNDGGLLECLAVLIILLCRLPVIQHVLLTTQILFQYGFIFVLYSFLFNTNTVRDGTKNNKMVGSRLTMHYVSELYMHINLFAHIKRCRCYNRYNCVRMEF